MGVKGGDDWASISLVRDFFCLWVRSWDGRGLTAYGLYDAGEHDVLQRVGGMTGLCGYGEEEPRLPGLVKIVIPAFIHSLFHPIYATN